MTRRSRKIGILGGTFNPVHCGHLLIAQDALERFRLDSVKFIPSAAPPHKSAEDLASARDRLQMVKLAIAGDDRFEVDDIELRRGGRSYSVDTLAELGRRHPDARFYFIIGSDSLQELHLWKDVGRLLRMCTIVTIARPGFEPTPALGTNLDARSERKILRHIVPGHACDIASRDIRRRIVRGLSIRYLVPDRVRDYILKHRLYR